jgi:hypothetical protein
MLLKPFASGMVLAALVTPALADDAYWVVQDPSTQNCSVVEQKSQPGQTQVRPAGAIGTAFRTQAEAQDSIIEMRKCGSAE